jgi:hypothetical protein
VNPEMNEIGVWHRLKNCTCGAECQPEQVSNILWYSTIYPQDIVENTLGAVGPRPPRSLPVISKSLIMICQA